MLHPFVILNPSLVILNPSHPVILSNAKDLNCRLRTGSVKNLKEGSPDSSACGLRMTIGVVQVDLRLSD